MRVGMIARAEDRGLGNLTWEWHRAMQPERTLIVIPEGVQKAGLKSHVERYGFGDPATVGEHNVAWARFDGQLHEPAVREWLDGLDVVYSAETFYDWRMCDWAREQNVATVCHAMPEFFHADIADRPTQWWAPTRWRLNTLPEGARVMPVPVPVDRWPRAWSQMGEREVRWLHIAGAQTIQDRNGTKAFMRALQLVRGKHEVTIATQEPLSWAYAPVATSVRVNVISTNEPDYWKLYAHGNALIMPRRYAGLCMPVLEAMGAGLAVIMSDMAPQNEEWPVATVATTEGFPVRLMGGKIPTGDVAPNALAQRMDQWVQDPERMVEARSRSRDWAENHSWQALKPTVIAELERAVAQLPKGTS